MRNAATASLLSTAVMLSSGCDRPPAKQEKPDPVRLATYRSLGAREQLRRFCGSEASRAAQRREDSRFDQLRQFAAQKKADHAIWLGENDYNAYARYAAPPGSADCGKALDDYRAHLDQLATAVAEHRE